MFGFTLAEVLITLVIIGVIAAITVPTLITKYQKEQTVTRLKKAYSTLSQASNRAIADFGPMTTWEIGTIDTAESTIQFINKYMLPYISVSKKPTAFSESNWNRTYYYLNGTEQTFEDNYVRFYLSDGTSITTKLTSYKYSADDIHYRLNMLIDINGDKKPNKYGKDIFLFSYWLDGQGFIPNAISSTREKLLSSDASANCNKLKTGGRCSALIIKDGWRIADDYPW